MEQEAATVEHHGRHAGLLGALGNRLADGSRAVLGGAGLALDVLVQARSRSERLARRVVDDLGVNVTARAVDREPRLASGTPAKRGAHPAATAFEEREMSHGLLLLAFFAEDVLTAILDALALVRLGLAPAADLGRDLADLLAIDAADLDGVLVGSLDVDAFGNREVHVVAVTELKAQVLALGLGAVADAGDLEHLGEAFGHARDEVLHQRTLHAPRGAVALRVGQRRDSDFTVGNLVLHEIVEHLHRELALGALHGQRAALDGGGNASRKGNGFLTNAGH